MKTAHHDMHHERYKSIPGPCGINIPTPNPIECFEKLVELSRSLLVPVHRIDWKRGRTHGNV